MLGLFTLPIMKNRINKKRNLSAKLFIVIGIVLIIVAVYFVFIRSAPNNNQYQAVFLDNNQVYFGKIQNRSGKYLTLVDVYYFGKDPLPALGQADSDDIVLVKLGSEMHGPVDKMEILENHILYIERLTDDSRVVKAIEKHKNNK